MLPKKPAVGPQPGEKTGVEAVVEVKRSPRGAEAARSLLVAILLLTVPCYGGTRVWTPHGDSAPERQRPPSTLPPHETDDELKRLQQVGQEHKAEPPWVIPVLIGGRWVALGGGSGRRVSPLRSPSQK